MIRFITFHVNPEGAVVACQVGDMPAPGDYFIGNLARVPYGVAIVKDEFVRGLDAYLIGQAGAAASPAGFSITLSDEALDRFEMVARGHSTYAGIDKAIEGGEALLPLTHAWLAARHSAEYVAANIPPVEARLGTGLIVDKQLGKLTPIKKVIADRFADFEAKVTALQKKES